MNQLALIDSKKFPVIAQNEAGVLIYTDGHYLFIPWHRCELVEITLEPGERIDEHYR